tara:strand:- start:11 stop:199 length:189 start_codon:yes stop_codon:yes gene_type:complete
MITIAQRDDLCEWIRFRNVLGRCCFMIDSRDRFAAGFDGNLNAPLWIQAVVGTPVDTCTAIR